MSEMMSNTDEIRKRRHEELNMCFRVMDTCLEDYYKGKTYMYRPLAAQLRILLCDNPPLLSRVFPNLEFGTLRSIEWLEPHMTTLFDGVQAHLNVQHPPGQEFRLSRMPFLVTKYSNGLQVADIELSSKGQLLPLGEWMDQSVTFYPSVLSIREIIRSIADKGGGAHVDDSVNEAMRHMMRTNPAGVGVDVLFIVALGRYMQKLGLHYFQFVDRFGYKGSLQDITIDPEHPTVISCAKISEELQKGPRDQFALTVLKRVQ